MITLDYSARMDLLTDGKLFQAADNLKQCSHTTRAADDLLVLTKDAKQFLDYCTYIQIFE